MRDKRIDFRVTEEERLRIKNNADKKGISVSKYCRDRSLKEELTQNEALDFLIRFINKTIDENSGDRKVWREWKLKDLTKPFDVKMKSLTMGMKEEERIKFETNWKEKMTEYKKISDELDEMLEKYYVEI